MPSSSHPLLLSVDGVDGSGKSTQVKNVAAALRRAGVPAEPIVVEAYGARSVNTLAEQMTGDRYAYHPTIPADLREWVFACDVAYFTKTQFPPRLDSGTTLVWDRGPLSYRASAQAYGGLSEWVERVHTLYPRPRFTYFLDLPADVAVDRLRRRVGKPQRTDESFRLLRQVRDLMSAEADSRPDIVRIDATLDADEITDRIVGHWLVTRTPAVGHAPAQSS